MAWEQLGAAELGAKHEAAAFKKIKPGMKVLFYFNAAYAWPYTSYNQDFTSGRIEARPELKEFLIIHPETGKLADRYGAFCYDVLNPDFRDWWVETVAKGVRETGCDGAFIDQMHGSTSLSAQ
jgi:alpha-glucosidase (family GH31 glycosyl hydrolase)